MAKRGAGTYPVSREALDLAAENVHLVDKVLRQSRTRRLVRGRHADPDDLRSFALQGLIRAADKYTPSKGDFETFATYVIWFWIRTAVHRAHGRHRVHQPPRVYATDWQEVEKTPEMRAGEAPKLTEYRALAVDDQDPVEQAEAVEAILELLTPQQRLVAELLAEGLTVKEIAARMGRTHGTVSTARHGAAAALLEAGYRRLPLRCVVCAKRIPDPQRSDAQCCVECLDPFKAARRAERRAAGLERRRVQPVAA